MPLPRREHVDSGTVGEEVVEHVPAKLLRVDGQEVQLIEKVLLAQVLCVEPAVEVHNDAAVGLTQIHISKVHRSGVLERAGEMPLIRARQELRQRCAGGMVVELKHAVLGDKQPRTGPVASIESVELEKGVAQCGSHVVLPLADRLAIGEQEFNLRQRSRSRRGEWGRRHDRSAHSNLWLACGWSGSGKVEGGIVRLTLQLAGAKLIGDGYTLLQDFMPVRGMSGLHIRKIRLMHRQITGPSR